jgi:NAD(P)-dependent dehydrogenase (short-subunit alcohol dehydrogenase family)
MNHPIAIITGGGRGIGKGISLALAERGWNIVLNYRRDADSALETAQSIEQFGVTALPVQADLAQAADRQALIDQTLARFGRVDLLVNNAGMAPRQRVDLLDVGDDSFTEIMDVNLKGPFFLTQGVAREMIRLLQSGAILAPKIINIGSISAFTVSLTRAEYCLSKAAMTMMTALFADRLAQHGILVYEIRPGIIETDMTARVKEKYDRLIEEGLLPIRRWGQPEDVARAVVALAEGGLPYSTGEILHVDGGFHIRRL